MKILKFQATLVIGLFLPLAVSCSGSNSGVANSNTTNSSAQTQAVNANTAEPPQTAKEVERDEASVVETSTSPDGTKTESRNFRSGTVTRVTRVTRPNGRRTATVSLRDGRDVEIKEQNDVEKAMDASADWLTSTANKAWDVTKSAGKEVGNTTENLAGKAVDSGKDAGKAVGKGVKRGAGEVADKAEDAAGAVKKGAKKAINKIKN